MIATTAPYKSLIDADVRQVRAKVQIDYTDALIDQSIERSANGEGRQSLIDQVANGIESPTRRWFAWGVTGSWDGYYLPNEHVEVGYHSAAVSRDDRTFLEGGPSQLAGTSIYGRRPYGKFVNLPTVTVGFSERPVLSVKAVFDDKLLEWAEEFDIEVYDADGVLQHTETVTGNTGVKYQVPITAINNAVVQKLIVRKWSRTGATAKVVEFLTSVSETYEGDEVFEVSVLEESETDDASLPIGNISANSCTVVLHNEDDRFGYNNPDSPLNNQIKENRRISIWLAVVGATDWIPMGVFYAKNWSVPEQALEVTVSGEDILSLMGQTEYSSTEIITAPSDQPFSDSTLTTWSLDNVELVAGEFRIAATGLLSADGGRAYALAIYGTIPGQPPTYYGRATRTFSVASTAGLTVVVAATYSATAPDNSELVVEISFNEGGSWQSVASGESVSGVFDSDVDGPQDLYVRVTLISRGAEPSFSSISLTVSQLPSLYSMAVSVCRDYGLAASQYTIDDELADYTIEYAYLDPVSHRAALQMIAEAGIARCYGDRFGVLRIVSARQIESSVAKTFSSDDYYELDNPAVQGKVTNHVVCTTKPLAPASVAEEVHNSTETVPAGDARTFTVFYAEKPVIDAALSTGDLSGGISLVSATYYTWGASIRLSNSNGTDTDTSVIIDGKPLRSKSGKRFEASNAESIRQFGKITYQFPDNQLIQDDDVAQLICDRLVDYFRAARRDVRIVAPGDPALELADELSSNGGRFGLVRAEYAYDGALEAQYAGRAL